jgi:hypothetical protein
MNGGNCSENGTSFSCQCPDGYTGQLCEIPSKYYFQKRTSCLFFFYPFIFWKEFCEIEFHLVTKSPRLNLEYARKFGDSG